MRCADVAMYAAKDGGRGRCEVFRPEMMRDTTELLGLEHDLRRGLKHGELTVHYQPSYEIDTQQIVGVEALVRWQLTDARRRSRPTASFPSPKRPG